MAAPLVILGICGSLRARSTNSALLEASARLAPAETRVARYDGMQELPHFNPDLDTDSPPEAVRVLRERVAAADALLIACPEYARGVPGSLKNLLDWLVGSVDVVGKPVALLNGSARASHAQRSLALTLATISALPIRDEPYLAPVLGREVSAEQILAEPALVAVLRQAITDLAAAARRV
jgi:NAD(P)H-dependent FMN reductase